MSRTLTVLSPGFINVQIRGDVHSEVSLELSSNGKLTISRLQQAFPGATRLIFERDGKLRMLTPNKENLFDPPKDGWNRRIYFVEKKHQQAEPKPTELVPPGEEDVDILTSWDILLNPEIRAKFKDFLTPKIDHETTPIFTTLLVEEGKIGLNENFEQLYGSYDKILDNNPIKSMFDRMDAALEKRRKKLEEERSRQSSHRRRSSDRRRSRSRSSGRSYQRGYSRERGSRRSRSRERRYHRSRSRDGLTGKESSSKVDSGDVEIVLERSGPPNSSAEDPVVLSSDEEVQVEDDSRNGEKNRSRSRSKRRNRSRSKSRSRRGNRSRSRSRKRSRSRSRSRRHRNEDYERYNRRKRILEEEEEKTKREREYFMSERMRLREERKRMEKALQDQLEQDRWLRKSDDFLEKLGIRTDVPPPQVNYRDRLDVMEQNESMHYRRDRSNSCDRLEERSDPDIFSRYSNNQHNLDRPQSPPSFDRGGYGEGMSYSRNLSPDGSTSASFVNARSSRYSPTEALQVKERFTPTDYDFRNKISDHERGPGPGRSLSPDVEEVQFGRSLTAQRARANSNSSSLSSTYNAPQQSANANSVQQLLKPGNYLPIMVDIVFIGDGLTSELYQIGAYSNLGDKFVNCIEPLKFKTEAENNVDLPMVMFKNKYHVNNRQTGIMEICVTEKEALRNLVNFIKTNLTRIRPHYDGAVLVCESNEMLHQLLNLINTNSLEGHFWSHVSSLGSLQFLFENHPNSELFLSRKKMEVEEVYYELFKQMLPFSKFFSDDKSKFGYEILVKLLDTAPGYLNYFKNYTFPRNSREMEKIKNPTFFLNKWETYAPLRLFVMRTLQSEREGMLDEDIRYLPRVDDVAKKMCRNLIEAGFTFEELLEMAKTRGLSETELQLRTVLLQRMAGQSRNVIDTAIRTTKLVIAFFVQNGHKSLGQLLEDVRTSKELSAEYKKPVPLPVPAPEPQYLDSGQGSSSAGGRRTKNIPSLLDLDVPPPSTSKKGDQKPMVFTANPDRKFDDIDKKQFEQFRKYIVNKVLSKGEPMKKPEINRFVNVLQACGVSIGNLCTAAEERDQWDGLVGSLKGVFNRVGPYNIGFETYKSWLKAFIDERRGVLTGLHKWETERKEVKKMMTGIPKSMRPT